MRAYGARKGFAVFAIAMAGIVAGFSVPHVIAHGPSFFAYFVEYGRDWASAGNLIAPGHWISVALNLLVFSSVGPFSEPKRAAMLSDAWGYLQPWFKVIPASLYVAYLAVAAVRTVASPDRAGQLVLGWMLFIVAFYVYFNPQEALLYSSQLMFPLVVLGARVFGRLRFPYKLPVAYVTVALAGLINLAILL